MLNANSPLGKSGLGYERAQGKRSVEEPKNLSSFVKGETISYAESKSQPKTTEAESTPKGEDSVEGEPNPRSPKETGLPETSEAKTPKRNLQSGVLDIGSLNATQLKDMLEGIPDKKASMLTNNDFREIAKNMASEKAKKENRNGKIGVGKATNFVNSANAPRKTCHFCGSTNHLRINCKLNPQNMHVPIAPVLPHIPPLITCQYCGSIEHPSIACNKFFNAYVHVPYAYPDYSYKKHDQNTMHAHTYPQQPKAPNSPRIKVELTNKVKTSGTKQAWLPKQE